MLYPSPPSAPRPRPPARSTSGNSNARKSVQGPTDRSPAAASLHRTKPEEEEANAGTLKHEVDSKAGRVPVDTKVETVTTVSNHPPPPSYCAAIASRSTYTPSQTALHATANHPHTPGWPLPPLHLDLDLPPELARAITERRRSSPFPDSAHCETSDDGRSQLADDGASPLAKAASALRIASGQGAQNSLNGTGLGVGNEEKTRETGVLSSKWIGDRSRDELERLLVEADKVIRERERDLSITAAIGQNLLEKNIYLRNMQTSLYAAYQPQPESQYPYYPPSFHAFPGRVGLPSSPPQVDQPPPAPDQAVELQPSSDTVSPNERFRFPRVEDDDHYTTFGSPSSTLQTMRRHGHSRNSSLRSMHDRSRKSSTSSFAHLDAAIERRAQLIASTSAIRTPASTAPGSPEFERRNLHSPSTSIDGNYPAAARASLSRTSLSGRGVTSSPYRTSSDTPYLDELAKQNDALLSQLADLQAEASRAEKAGKRKLRKLEKEMHELKAEMERLVERNGELEARGEQTESKRGKGPDVVTWKGDVAGGRSETDGEDANMDPPRRAESRADDSPPSSRLFHQKRSAAKGEDEVDNGDPTPVEGDPRLPPSLSSRSLASSSSTNDAPVDPSAPEVERALVSQLMSKIAELEEANVAIAAQREHMDGRMERVMYEADRMRRAYEDELDAVSVWPGSSLKGNSPQRTRKRRAAGNRLIIEGRRTAKALASLARRERLRQAPAGSSGRVEGHDDVWTGPSVSSLPSNEVDRLLQTSVSPSPSARIFMSSPVTTSGGSGRTCGASPGTSLDPESPAARRARKKGGRGSRKSSRMLGMKDHPRIQITPSQDDLGRSTVDEGRASGEWTDEPLPIQMDRLRPLTPSSSKKTVCRVVSALSIGIAGGRGSPAGKVRTMRKVSSCADLAFVSSAPASAASMPVGDGMSTLGSFPSLCGEMRSLGSENSLLSLAERDLWGEPLNGFNRGGDRLIHSLGSELGFPTLHAGDQDDGGLDLPLESASAHAESPVRSSEGHRGRLQLPARPMYRSYSEDDEDINSTMQPSDSHQGSSRERSPAHVLGRPVQRLRKMMGRIVSVPGTPRPTEMSRGQILRYGGLEDGEWLDTEDAALVDRGELRSPDRPPDAESFDLLDQAARWQPVRWADDEDFGLPITEEEASGFGPLAIMTSQGSGSGRLSLIGRGHNDREGDWRPGRLGAPFEIESAEMVHARETLQRLRHRRTLVDGEKNLASSEGRSFGGGAVGQSSNSLAFPKSSQSSADSFPARPPRSSGPVHHPRRSLAIERLGLGSTRERALSIATRTSSSGRRRRPVPVFSGSGPLSDLAAATGETVPGSYMADEEDEHEESESGEDDDDDLSSEDFELVDERHQAGALGTDYYPVSLRARYHPAMVSKRLQNAAVEQAFVILAYIQLAIVLTFVVVACWSKGPQSVLGARGAKAT